MLNVKLYFLPGGKQFGLLTESRCPSDRKFRGNKLLLAVYHFQVLQFKCSFLKTVFTDHLMQNLVTFPGIDIVSYSAQKPDSSNANSVKFVFGQNMLDRVVVKQ